MPLTSVDTTRRTDKTVSNKIPSFCVVLPCFNEETVLEKQISAISTVLERIPTRTAIIAVDDGSTDGTRKILGNLRNTYQKLLVEIRTQNGGYGGANRTGFAAAIREGFDYCLVMDADGTQDPIFIEAFLNKMSEGVDFIKATRYIAGSRVIGVDWRRKWISAVGNTIARIILRTPLTDYTNGFRAIKTSLLKNIETRERGFSMLVEEVVMAKALGAKFAEVPYELTVRCENGSESKFTYNAKVYMGYLKQLFR